MRKSVALYEKAFEIGQLQALTEMTSVQAHERQVLHLAILANALFGEWSAALMHFRWSERKKIRFTQVEEATINFALGVGHTPDF